MAAQPPLAPEEFPIEAQQGHEFHLSQWLEVIRRRRKLLLAVCAVVLGVSFVQFLITPPLYRATTIIQIERRAASMTTMEKVFQVDLWDQEFYPTQYRLLKSRGLAERAVRNLHLDENPAFNPARARLPVKTDAQGATADDDEAMLGSLAERVLGGLDINPIRNTRLVEVSFVAGNPDLAARVANGVAATYIDWGIETHYAKVGKASSFLASQIEGLKQEIQDKESQLQAYGRRTDIVTLDPASNVTLQRLEALNKDYIAAVSERINKEAHYKELMSAPKEAIAETLGGGLVGQMRADILKLEREYATKLNIYKPEWPAMQELQAQIDKSRQHLDGVIDETVARARDAAKADYESAGRREAALTAELARQKGEAMRLNSAAVEYNNLKVEVSTRRALLDELVRKQSETEVASRLSGTKDSNVIVVDRALVPHGPFRPSLRRSLLIGLVLGLGLGLGVVFLLEYLDRTIKTPEDIDRVLALPVLAVVPDVSAGSDSYGYYGYYGVSRRHRKTHPLLRATRAVIEPRGEEVKIELLPHLKPRLAVSESYRTLRTALQLSTAGGLRSVVVSSATPSEGKTATASNLAVVFAQLGGDVLLVDADLRKPRLHDIFNVSNRVGLVNYLTNLADESKIFLPTEISSLFVCPSGPISPNPAELLASARMREFIEVAKRRFAFIIFDSPPTLPVTDATLLGSLTDGVVLCIGAGRVLREDAVTCWERLRLAEVHVLGAVLNWYRVGVGRYGKQYRSYEAYVDSSALGETRTDAVNEGAAAFGAATADVEATVGAGQPEAASQTESQSGVVARLRVGRRRAGRRR